MEFKLHAWAAFVGAASELEPGDEAGLWYYNITLVKIQCKLTDRKQVIQNKRDVSTIANNYIPAACNKTRTYIDTYIYNYMHKKLL